MKKWKLSRGRLLVVAILVAAGLNVWFLYKRRSKGDCDYSESILVQDRDMPQFFDKPIKANLYPNHYLCYPPHAGEVVAYKFSGVETVFFRLIRAGEGDDVRVDRDEESGGWGILVNGKPVIHEGRPWIFGVSVKTPTLRLYVKEGETRKLKGPETVILSTLPPGFNDSTFFGLRNAKDFLGRVELPSESQERIDHYFQTGETVLKPKDAPAGGEN